MILISSSFLTDRTNPWYKLMNEMVHKQKIDFTKASYYAFISLSYMGGGCIGVGFIGAGCVLLLIVLVLGVYWCWWCISVLVAYRYILYICVGFILVLVVLVLDV